MGYLAQVVQHESLVKNNISWIHQEYNLGQKLLDPSLFYLHSSVYSTKFMFFFFFLNYEMESLFQTLVSKMEFPLTTPVSVLHATASTVWINIENGERGK